MSQDRYSEEFETEEDAKAFRKNYEVGCDVCGAYPTVGDSELCGPCCFGESETIGGNW